jgi:hypothetical protein
MVYRPPAPWPAGAGMRGAGRRSIRWAAGERRTDFSGYTFFAFFLVTPAATRSEAQDTQ